LCRGSRHITFCGPSRPSGRERDPQMTKLKIARKKLQACLFLETGLVQALQAFTTDVTTWPRCGSCGNTMTIQEQLQVRLFCFTFSTDNCAQRLPRRSSKDHPCEAIVCKQPLGSSNGRVRSFLGTTPAFQTQSASHWHVAPNCNISNPNQSFSRQGAKFSSIVDPD
jgi:hypothetical protein